jgi:hypothetical protein
MTDKSNLPSGKVQTQVSLPPPMSVTLTEYVDSVLSGYTEEAVAATVVEVDTYCRALDTRAHERARVDTAERVLEKHVRESVAELRSRANEDIKNFSDWIKRIGFLLLGLAVQQVNAVVHSDPIQLSSVVWLLILAMATFAFIAGGVIIDKPLSWVVRKFRGD